MQTSLTGSVLVVMVVVGGGSVGLQCVVRFIGFCWCIPMASYTHTHVEHDDNAVFSTDGALPALQSIILKPHNSSRTGKSTRVRIYESHIHNQALHYLVVVAVEAERVSANFTAYICVNVCGVFTAGNAHGFGLGVYLFTHNINQASFSPPPPHHFATQILFLILSSLTQLAAGWKIFLQTSYVGWFFFMLIFFSHCLSTIHLPLFLWCGVRSEDHAGNVWATVCVWWCIIARCLPYILYVVKICSKHRAAHQKKNDLPNTKWRNQRRRISFERTHVENFYISTRGYIGYTALSLTANVHNIAHTYLF